MKPTVSLLTALLLAPLAALHAADLRPSPSVPVIAKGARQVYLSISTDMQHWSEPELVMNPDETDHAKARELQGGMHAEFYNMSAFPYAGQWLGLITVFRRTGPPPMKGPGQSGDDGPIDVQLVHSRDGRTWQRCSDRSPVIALGPHSYDAGSINADVRSGWLLVEVLDAEGRTVPGFEKSACLQLTGGAVRQAVKWRGESSLPQGKPLRLRFHLTDGDLYSYSFETSP